MIPMTYLYNKASETDTFLSKPQSTFICVIFKHLNSLRRISGLLHKTPKPTKR